MSAGDLLKERTAHNIINLILRKSQDYNLKQSGYTLEDGINLAIEFIEKEYNLEKEDNA